MDYLALLEETHLREIAGDKLFSQAEYGLISGKVTGRIRMAENEIQAFWVDASQEHEMHAANQSKGLGLACSCEAMEARHPCQHTIALLLAWVREPYSFIFEDEEEEEDRSYGPGRQFSPEVTLKAAETLPDPAGEYREWLSALGLQELREMAGRLGVKAAGNRKDPIVEALATSLARPERVAEAWQTLSPPARLLIGVIPFSQDRRQFPLKDLIRDAARAWGLTSDAEFDQAMEELNHQGLVFYNRYGWYNVSSMLPFWLPTDPQFSPEYPGAEKLKRRRPEKFAFTRLATRLILFLGAPGKENIARSAPEQHSIEKKSPYLRGWPYDPKDLDQLAQEKYSYNAFWNRAFRVPPAPPLLPDDSRRRLLETLKIDGNVLDLGLRLLESSGILTVTPGEPITVNRQEAGRLWQADPFDRASMFFLYYAGLQNWTEFDLAAGKNAGLSLQHTASLPESGTYQQMLEQLANLRHYLLLQIRRQPAGRWVDFKAFVERARLLPVNKKILNTKSFWYVDVQGHRANYDKLSDWRTVYGAFVEAVLAGPLFYQGLVELAYQGELLAAFRLTDFGADILSPGFPGQAATAQAEGPVLTYSSSGELAVDPDGAQGSLLELLMTMGEPRLALNKEIAYRLTPQGAGEAFESGWSMESILAVLKEAAGKPAPIELVNSLKKWWDNFGTVRFYQDLALIELGDDFILNELLAGTSLPKHLIYRFSPRLIAVRSDSVETLREEWVKKGYTPKVAA